MPRKRLPRSEISVEHRKRKWVAEHEQDEVMLRQLFELINIKLTVNEISAIPHEKFEEMIEKLRRRELLLEDLKNYDSNELYELMTGVVSEEID